MQTHVMNDAQWLHQIARDYITNGLGAKNFDAISYDDNVTLHAPLFPGGSEIPLTGKENLRNVWWAPLPSLVGKVNFIDSYTNEENNAVSVQFHREIINPACVLRVIDRFIINEMGKIISRKISWIQGQLQTRPKYTQS